MKQAKARARALLLELTSCPSEKIDLGGGFWAEFSNGLVNPEKLPPFAVSIEIDGQTYRTDRKRKKWYKL